LNEINKIELLEDQTTEMKKQILGQVPTFLIKVSKSYYQRVDQYSRNLLQKVNHAQQNCQGPVPNILPLKDADSKIPN
jgi:hypothetical protein